MNPPEFLQTARVTLRRPRRSDAEAIFERYASDPEVTRYLGWPRHRSVEDSHGFVRYALDGWETGRDLPYLAFAREDGRLLGSTGLHFETPARAFTGYVLARDAWGRGLATEMASAMAALAFSDPQLHRFFAYCHVDNPASARVMEKAGMQREGVLRRYLWFPNLEAPVPGDVVVCARVRG